MHATEALREADRLMTVCNSCRYCEGLCAVFPAMEMRRSFSSGDLNYLANLCHGCGACYFDCQFSPPHEYAVNVPKVLAVVRAESYRAYAWPRRLSGLFDRNGTAISILTTLAVTMFILGFILFNEPENLFAVHTGPGAFYRIMPHDTMVLVFGLAFGFACLAMAMGFRMFWKDIGEPVQTLWQPHPLLQATRDVGRLTYLDGGGVGCMNKDERPTDNRRLYHHFTLYGFLLCFMATSTATLYHYMLGMEAPYPWYDLPVVLGSLGGIGLIVGPLGMLRAKFTRDPDMQDDARFGGDTAFILMLLLTSVTGFALLFLRATPLMGLMLALHLGVVFSLFIVMPYSKFVHGLYRGGALLRYARERKAFLGP